MACNRKSEPKEILGLNRITKKRLLELCKKNKLYQTPSLNDVLYLHYQGFQSIECLEEYTELKCLWLECNAISEIQGLDNQIKLKCLFLQSNLIKKIENLEYCKELDTINLSQNHIRKIENCGIDILPVLNTLNISSNYIKDSDGLKELENCINLSVLDLSNNRIDDILVVKIFNKMPELKVLVLQGNPVVSKIPQYRKTMTLECKKLTYLDSRPVFPKDRACAEAWKIGGYEGERKENERWNRRERKKMRDSVNATIRMRNKNRKPEDILTLLTSSDSEDESDAKKRSRQNDVGAGVSIDSIWDEVAEDSSDLTSETSTTDSNGQGNSSECCANEAGETPKIDEHKILNDCFENNTKVCHSAENEKSIKQFENKCGQDKSLDIDVKQIVEHYESIELKKHDNKTMMRADPDDDMKIMPKKIKIDIGEIELGQQSSENNVFSLNACSSSSRLSNNSLYSDEDSKDQYKDTVDAICHATMNNLSETDDFSTTPLQLQVENFNAKDEENYEPLKELEETMNTIIKKEYSERETERQVNFSSFNQNMLTVETQECSEINHQLKKDFEKLSSDMDNFMLQLQKDKDDRQKAMEVLFDKIVPSQESSSASSENEAEVNMAEWKLENMVDQWERETRLKKDASNKMPEIRINSKPCKVETMIHCEDSQQETNLINKEINKEICCATIGDGIRPHKADIEQLENIQDVSNYDAIFTNNVDSQEPHAENDLTMEQQFPPSNLSALPADALSRISVDSEENDFEYIPMDITLLARNSHVALNSIEKEAKELKVLLQKLEDENMDLFKEINTESKCHAEEHSKENIFKDVQEKLLQKEYKEDSDKSIQRKYDEDLTLTSKNEIKITLQENANEQLTENFEELENESGKNEMEDENSKSSFGEQLVQEIIQCLELRTLKPKSYEFDIISDEEYSYSESIVEQEDLLFTKPIPDFLQSFKLFSKTISNEIKTPSIGKPNSCGLPELANRRKQQDLNTETHKSLDEQLQLFKEEQTKQIRRMVDRVYAQKERYNDTIEVIDGKLMVRNKDTGEVKELPPPPKHFSDSDTEYDTAQSEENEDEACCSKSKQLRSDQSTHERTNDQRLSDCKGNWGFSRHKSDGWPISHKPNQRKSAENLITLALAQNRKSYLTENGNEDSSSDESHDEFFSLDQQNKPNLYGNIDAEFFNTLTLDHLKLSEQDEHHMNQCARSYEDMKTFLKLTKDEECSINENNENPHMLRNNVECCDEDLLLKKLMERAKEKEGFENGNKESNRNNYDVDINRMPYKICKEAVKIFEYKYEQNYHNASSSYPLAKALNEIESTSESVNENSTEVFGNNVYTFVFEEPETESVEDKEQLRGTEFVENEEELSRQDFMKNVLMRNISLQTCKAEEEKLSCTDLNSPKSADSILCPEKYSEEEKNEIESNVDVEGIAINNKFEFVSPKECLEQNSHHEPLPTEEYGTSNCRNSTIEFFKTTQSSESTPIISNHEDCIQTVSSVAANTSSSKTFVLKTLPDSKNNPIILTDDNSQEQQNIFYNTDCEQHIYLESYLPDLSTNSPPSTQNQCFGKISLNDNNSTEYLTLNSPPLSSATTQPVENILPTDNFNENSQHSVKTTTSSVSKHYKLPLQVNTVNSQIPSQNAAYSDAYFKESENDSQSQDTSENLETQEHDVLECNLEILGCNDEIIETITVNAELHYDY